MSLPREPEKAKLITGLFSSDRPLIFKVIEELEQIFGDIDWISHELSFDRTRYYEKEMGWPLWRRFLSFKRLIDPEDIADIKITTNEVEKRYLRGNKRMINIDPGYICLERLILATGKNYAHRIYLNRGIYADLTLIYKKGSFIPLGWTYKDYADPEIIRLFNIIRDAYKRQIRGIHL